MKYLVLLRGINVGGNNVIKKDQLKECFVKAGCESVITYIQSGNIIFKSASNNKSQINKNIQKELTKVLGKTIPITIFTETEYQKCIAAAPQTWGKIPDAKHNALFYLNQYTAKDITASFPIPNPQVEIVTHTPRATFWSASKENYNKTNYAKELVKSAGYKMITIRNCNTSNKLLELFAKIS